MNTPIVLECQGVRFEWSVSEDWGDCMNRARVSVGDACHSIEGELSICFRERAEESRWEWVATIHDGGGTRKGHDTGRIGVEVRAFVQAAMQGTAAFFLETLTVKQKQTREMLAKRERQRDRAMAVHRILEEL